MADVRPLYCNIRVFTSEEIEFLAQDEFVTITPSFDSPTLGQYGPFYASRDLSVPLWLALFIRKQRRCYVRLPVWCTRGSGGGDGDDDDIAGLQRLIEEEKKDFNKLTVVPFHYIEILTMLLQNAPEDFGADFEKISSLFQDLTDLRWNKLMKQVADFNQEVDMIKLDNVSYMELNRARPMLTGILGGLSAISPDKIMPLPPKSNEGVLLGEMRRKAVMVDTNIDQGDYQQESGVAIGNDMDVNLDLDDVVPDAPAPGRTLFQAQSAAGGHSLFQAQAVADNQGVVDTWGVDVDIDGVIGTEQPRKVRRYDES